MVLKCLWNILGDIPRGQLDILDSDFRKRPEAKVGDWDGDTGWE